RLHPSMRRQRESHRQPATTHRAPSAAGPAGVALVLTAVVAAITGLLSGSRAAVASMLAAGVFLATCVARSRTMGRRGWVGVPILAVIVGAGLAFGWASVLAWMGPTTPSQR